MKRVAYLVPVLAMFLAGVIVGGDFKTTTHLQSQPVVSVQAPIFTDTDGVEVKYPEKPTVKQSNLLKIAYNTGKNDGLHEPQIVQAILIEETKAGTLPRYKVIGQEYGLKPNERYYGVMQIKLRATWDVLRRWPCLWEQFGFNTHTDEEIISKLVDDDRFNIAVASKYLLILRDRGFNSMPELAMAYNMGPGAAHHADPETNTYSQEVMTHVSSLRN